MNFSNRLENVFVFALALIAKHYLLILFITVNLSVKLKSKDCPNHNSRNWDSINNVTASAVSALECRLMTASLACSTAKRLVLISN